MSPLDIVQQPPYAMNHANAATTIPRLPTISISFDRLAPLVKLFVVKTRLKSISVALIQFEALTSFTSDMSSVNVMSTHCHCFSSAAALHPRSSILSFLVKSCCQKKSPAKTYTKKRSPMLRRLHNLQCRIVPTSHRDIRGKRHLRQAHIQRRIRIITRSRDLEDREERMRVVGWDGAETDVDVEVSGFMAGEPAGLKGDGAAGERPVGAISC
jgi:hypothetical protein